MFPLYDTIPAQRQPVVTWAIIGLNLLFFLYELSLSSEEVQALFYQFGLVPARYTRPAWAEANGLAPNNYLPFLLNMFLHGGIAHFVGNMWTLWIFGDNVEDLMGRWRFAAFYLLTGLHLVFNSHSPIPSVGASGAISGVMGAYLFLFPRSRIVFLFPLLFLPIFIPIPALLYLGGWFVVQFVSGVSSTAQATAPTGGVAFWAHIGGFVGGLLLHKLFLQLNVRGETLPDILGLN